MSDSARHEVQSGRRQFLTGAAALGLVCLAPSQGWGAPAFASRRISVKTTGAGPDVVMIPGLGSSPSIWQASIAAVSGYRYHLVQVKGFANTQAEANGSGAVVEPVAEEIARYISAMGLKRPALIGHSMGGTLALLLATRFPAMPGKLMVVDMTPAGAGMVGGTASGMGLFATRLGNYFSGTKGGRQMLQQLMGMFGADPSENDPDTIASALQDLAKIDLTPDLPRIKVPMTVLYATPANAEQRAAIVQRYRTAYAGAKGALLKPVGSSGHMIMFDQPRRFADEMRAFLQV